MCEVEESTHLQICFAVFWCEDCDSLRAGLRPVARLHSPAGLAFDYACVAGFAQDDKLGTFCINYSISCFIRFCKMFDNPSFLGYNR